jgi:ABC-type lipopolysaccharide export system ATPase subunit
LRLLTEITLLIRGPWKGSSSFFHDWKLGEIISEHNYPVVSSRWSLLGGALVTNPRLLLLDEATEGLAPLMRQEIWRCLRLLKDQGQSVVVVDKNINMLMRIAERHVVVEKGRTVWSGTSTELCERADIQARYLLSRHLLWIGAPE